MNDESAFLATIRANPGDDTARLVFADWLDEHDQPERAEFIRVEIELANFGGWKDVTGDDRRRRQGRFAHLMNRQRRLVGSVIAPFFSDLFGVRYETEQARIDCGPRGTILRGNIRTEPRRTEYRIATSRGMVALVRCPQSDWDAHAEAIRAKHALARHEVRSDEGDHPLDDV